MVSIFKPTPDNMRVLWASLGDAAKEIETSIAIISIDPGVNCGFAVQVFDADKSQSFDGAEDYSLTTWVTKAPKRKLKNGKNRSYLDPKKIAMAVDMAFAEAIKKSNGPLTILVVVEDNGAPITPGAQAAWTMAECIGCIKGCLVNTISLVVKDSRVYERIEAIRVGYVRPTEWVRRLGLNGVDKLDRIELVHQMLFESSSNNVPKESKMNEHQTDAVLVGLFAGIDRLYGGSWEKLLVAAAEASDAV